MGASGDGLATYRYAEVQLLAGAERARQIVRNLMAEYVQEMCDAHVVMSGPCRQHFGDMVWRVARYDT